MSGSIPPCVFVGVDGGCRIGDFRFDGDPKVLHGAGDVVQLVLVDPSEDPSEDVIAERLGVFEHRDPRGAHVDQDDPAILRDTSAGHESALLHPIHQAGRVRDGDIEDFGQAAHRHLAVTLQHVQDVQLGHADALTEEALATDALQLHHRRPEVGHDAVCRRLGDGPGRVYSLCHANYHIETNHPVNVDDVFEPLRRAVDAIRAHDRSPAARA